MISLKISELLNKQVNAEFYASNVYLQMCAWAEDQGLEGAADFFRTHSLEEREHMDKIFNYMAECGAPVTIEAIPKAPREYSHLMDVIEAAFEHEKHVTAMIKNIAKTAFESEDYTTFNFIEWFIAEQHEEEVLFGKVLGRAEMLDFTGEKGQKLMIMDNYLKQLAAEH
ncbi:ferritin [Thiomicrorhabdus sp. 6S2-11]|jgi:ferritin|uniref:Ferritin n=1 Tax=Thiomicrorhabdus marina TaxID=2818442 RepID=A0ABS3Q8F4_9GAMM|nr:ferritin [Thiomicrorhabdus marina]MBO1928105.1 ferritin [Thiomicrorhabdus marina]